MSVEITSKNVIHSAVLTDCPPFLLFFSLAPRQSCRLESEQHMLGGAGAASVDTAPGVCTTDVGAPTDGVPVWSGGVGEEGSCCQPEGGTGWERHFFL